MNTHLLAELVDESDVIFHLAAAVGVRLIVESPVRTIATNVHGTQNVLDAASKRKNSYSQRQHPKYMGKATRCLSTRMQTRSRAHQQGTLELCRIQSAR